MTTINDATSASGVNQVMEAGQKKQLTPEDFMKLFLAQMKNQNPMHPTDNNAILQQMAEISTITASKDMQKTLNTVSQNVSTALTNSQVLEATQLIGKKVVVPSEVVPLVSGEGLSGSAYLPATAAAVTVTVKDGAGKTVKTIECGPSSSGLVDFKWDGKDVNGQPLKADLYKVSAAAVINGAVVPVNTAGAFTVKSVGLNPQTGSAMLNIDIGSAGMGDVVKIL